jgi:transcription elongation factor Elf1
MRLTNAQITFSHKWGSEIAEFGQPIGPVFHKVWSDYSSSRMGKRRAAKTQRPTAKVYKMPKFFACPFCASEDSIRIKIDRKKKSAELSCRSCDVKDTNFQVHTLTEPIDIYTEWRDAAVEANKKYNPAVVGPESDSSFDEDHDGPVEYDTGKQLQHARRRSSSGSDSSQLGSELESA